MSKKPQKSSDSKAKDAAVKLGKSEVQAKLADEEEADSAKEVAQPPPWLGVLLDGKVCLFPGIRKQPQGEDIFDFTDCLPLLGSCDVLIFCELNRTQTEIEHQIAQRVGKEYGGIQTRVYTPTPADLDLSLPKTDQLFQRFAEACPDWVPDDAKPPMDQFWGLLSVFEIGFPGDKQKKLHLLHLGIGDEAAWLYFLQPHNIRVARVIMNAPRREILEAP